MHDPRVDRLADLLCDHSLSRIQKTSSSSMRLTWTAMFLRDLSNLLSGVVPRLLLEANRQRFDASFNMACRRLTSS